MKPELINYEVTPMLVPADRAAEIVIRPRFEHCRFAADAEYRVEHYLMEQVRPGRGGALAATVMLKPVGGCLHLAGRFPGEQEHWLRITPPAPQNRTPTPIDLHVYSLKPDLHRRRPFKGDFHLHSCRSDGRESPAYAAGACRRIGLDFTAITDHHRYEPSLEAIAAFGGVSRDLRLFPGEEVHLPEHPVHMINYGGAFSVNAKSKEPAYRAEVDRIQRRLARRLPRGVDPYHAAGCVWAFDKVRQGGGLGVYCHPHWVTGNAYNVGAALNDWLFAVKPFDAFEVTGGYYLHQAESNFLQVLWYQEQRALGRDVPVIGASDAHGCERDLFGWYYTIVWAPSLEFADLAASVRAGYSVAVEALPGQTPRAHGPYRLAKCAHFLLREVLPLHDEFCTEEGRLMLAHVAGDRQAARQLAALSGRTARLFERVFGRKP